MPDRPSWFVGVDWASATHHATLLDARGAVLGQRTFAHGGAGLAELCDWLSARTGAEPAAIAAAIEVPHGPVVEALLGRGFRVFSCNPKQLDRFRDRFTVAGAKDDRLDARVLADALRTDGHLFRPLAPSHPLVVELREWSRMAEDLQGERNRLANHLREQLWRYYPQALELADDLAAEWFLDLLELAPTPAETARRREATVARLLKRHRIRRLTAAEVLKVLRRPPLAVAPGTVAAATAHVGAAAARLRLVNRQLRDAHARLDALCGQLAEAEPEPGQPPEPHDAAILRSLPGVGRIVLATLLAEAAEPLQRRDYHALRSLAGVAPVTRRSGKRCIVLMCQACHLWLRTAVYHWARVAAQRDARSRARYAELRKRGHSHGRALRSVADRLLAVACARPKARTTFAPERHAARPAVT